MSEEINVNINEIKVRKPYIKPQLERVKLSLDETVLGQGCKTPTSPLAPIGGQTGCAISSCNADGS